MGELGDGDGLFLPVPIQETVGCQRYAERMNGGGGGGDVIETHLPGESAQP